MTKDRKTPERTCVACRTTSGKQAFVRVVRTADGDVRQDPTGKASGRGAYVCPKEECVALALKQKRLDRALRAHVPAALAEDLMRMAMQVQEQT